jgi:hypothetical protein
VKGKRLQQASVAGQRRCSKMQVLARHAAHLLQQHLAHVLSGEHQAAVPGVGALVRRPLPHPPLRSFPSLLRQPGPPGMRVNSGQQQRGACMCYGTRPREAALHRVMLAECGAGLGMRCRRWRRAYCGRRVSVLGRMCSGGQLVGPSTATRACWSCSRSVAVDTRG